MSVHEQMTTILSQAGAEGLDLQGEDALRINPKWSIIAKLFVNLLSQEIVVPRLNSAQTVTDLKAILFVDHYLSRMKNGRFRQHIQTLLANSEIPLPVIERYAALSFARNVVWQHNEYPQTLDENPLYSVEAAATQLGVPTESLYDAISMGTVTANLYLTWSEVARLTEEPNGF